MNHVIVNRALQASGWWLGDVNNRIFRLAEKAVEDVWGQKPLLVREGGSYGGVTAFLETLLGEAVCVHGEACRFRIRARSRAREGGRGV